MDETREQEASNQPVGPNFGRIDSAILVLLLTVGGYALAFAYQDGYLGYFGVPAYLAEVSPRELLLFAGATAGAAVAAYNLFIAAAAKLPAAVPRVVAPILLATAFAWVEMLLLLWLYGAPLAVWVVTLLIVSVFTFVHFGVPIFFHRDTPGYFAKVAVSIEKIRADLGSGPPRLLHRIPLKVTATVGIAYGALILVNAVGAYEARTCSVFLVDQTGEPCVVLRSMSDGLLCAAFSAEKHAVTGSYRLVKPDRADLQLENVGRLNAPKPYDPLASASRGAQEPAQTKSPPGQPVRR